MKIQEALKETGKAMLSTSGRNCWAEVVRNTLMWNNAEPFPVNYDTIIRNDWQSYSPSLVKCEACYEACKIYQLEQVTLHDFNITKWRIDHLRKYHCTCKRGSSHE